MTVEKIIRQNAKKEDMDFVAAAVLAFGNGYSGAAVYMQWSHGLSEGMKAEQNKCINWKQIIWRHL